MAPAFLVDGLTEKKIVQKLCHGATVRMTGVNGKDVELSAIAKAAHSLISLFKGRHYPVILIMDREKRQQSSEEIEDELKRLLEKLGVMEEVIISCPGRMLESWMLSDDEYFEEIYDIKLDTSYEGSHGKREIRKLLAEKKQTYHEVSVGVDLFCSLDAARIAINSSSFARFRSKTAHFCGWLRR